MRPDGNGSERLDDAEALLPPPRELPVDPDDQLWHTASFAAIADEPAPRRKRKLTAGLGFLGAATIGVCAYAGVELAGIAGLNPPSSPRYVINEQVDTQQGDGPSPAMTPPIPATPARPPAVNALPAAPAASDGPAPRAFRGDGHNSDRKRSDSDRSEKRKRKSSSND